jgi:SAM-dependent methyltransferase
MISGKSLFDSKAIDVIDQTRDHWQRVHSGRPATEASWYQPEAARSLAYIEAACPDRRSSIIDVGGGASTLVDGLLAKGYADIAVLDIADAALAVARRRLAAAARKVSWLVADVTNWTPPRRWHCWHDRAVFHFLVDPVQQDAYVTALTAATAPDSMVIMATFALDGPERCSGLPVQRYSAAKLADRLGPNFRLRKETHVRPRTPSGGEQSFCWAVFQRLTAADH